jgi:hypothetical protein
MDKSQLKGIIENEIKLKKLSSDNDNNKKYLLTVGKNIQEMKKQLSEIETVAPELFKSSTRSIKELEKKLISISDKIDSNINKVAVSGAKSIETKANEISKEFDKSLSMITNEVSAIKRIVGKFAMIKDGADGKGIDKVYLDKGRLIVLYSNGEKQDVGKIVPENDIVPGRKGAGSTLTVFDTLESDNKANPLSANQGKILKALIDAGGGGGGTGDMTKAVYDINNNGIVDDSEKVNGLTVETAVPSGALFTDTIYTLPVASTTIGGVKSGTDITVDGSGNVSVVDDSHNHVISNVDGLQDVVVGKLNLDQTTPQSVINGSPIMEGIQFDITPSTTNASTGLMRWNEDDGTLDVGLPSGVTGQMFQEMFYDGKNRTGADIPNGTPIMFAAAVGSSGKVKIQKAIANGTIPSEYIMGISTETIANGEFGKVTCFGKVRGLNTSGTPYSETWLQNDLIYVGKTAGSLTNVVPPAPEQKILIASVIVASATVGTLLIRPTWATKLTDLEDVNGTALTVSGQIPVWDNTNKYFDFTDNINNKASITGTETLTNKTLTSPKINEDVALTASATELNILDGIPATLTATELGYVDGVTSSIQTQLNGKQATLTGLTSTVAELNVLDGVTSTASEINILDGATLTVTELNYVDGVTSAIQTQLGNKAPLASPTFTGTVTTDILDVGNTTSIMEILETANLVATAYATTPTATNIDLKSGGIFYNTVAATGNIALNIRGDSTTTANTLIGIGKSMTFTILITQTATPYYISSYTIDGTSVTPKWTGTAPSAGNANSIDSYTLTIIKTAATPTYTVLASRSKFA